MMFLDGYIAAPPTITVFSSARAGATKVEVSASALNAAAERIAMRLDMDSSRFRLKADEAIVDCGDTQHRADHLVMTSSRRVGRSYGRVLPAVSRDNLT